MTAVDGPWMTSTVTAHRAKRIAIRPGRTETREYWLVSWLPHRTLTRGQATTAMLLAEAIAEGVDDRQRRQRIVCWAAELDLTGPEAAQLAAGEPHILDTRHHEMSLSCWCEPRTALDGHRNDDGAPVEFAATDQDPVGVDGWLMEVIQ